MKKRVNGTTGGDSIPVWGAGRVNIISHSGKKTVLVALDEKFLLRGCRCDLSSPKAWGRSGHFYLGKDGVIPLFDGKIIFPVIGIILCRRVAYRATRDFLRTNRHPPPKHWGIAQQAQLAPAGKGRYSKISTNLFHVSYPQINSRLLHETV